MKITKRQLRRIIRESYMKERYGQMEDAILSTLWENPGIAGMDLVAAVVEWTINGAPAWEAAPDQSEVFSILDNLLEEDEVVFNEEEDEWSLSDMGNYYDYERGFKS